MEFNLCALAVAYAFFHIIKIYIKKLSILILINLVKQKYNNYFLKLVNNTFIVLKIIYIPVYI